MPLHSQDFRLRVRFVIRLGRALHECGTTSERCERLLGNVTNMLGLQGSFLVSPTTFTCAFWDEDELDQFVHIERVEPSDYNLGRLWELDRLVEDMELGKTSLADGIDELSKLSSSPPYYSFKANTLSWLLIAACFATLLSSNPYNAFLAAGISVLIFLIVGKTAARANWKPVTTILGAIAAGLIASGAAAAGLPINAPFVVLSSVIIFVPGLALTVSLTEISSGHLISGCSRLVDAMMILLKLFFGAVTGIALTRYYQDAVPRIFDDVPELGGMPVWRVWPALIGLALSLGVGLNIPRHRICWGVFAMLIAFSAALLGESHFGMFAGVFLGALSVGIYANIFSRLTRGPGHILMTFGIIVLVPGSKIYSILNQWVSGDSILPGESVSTATMGLVALIAGLLFANALMPATSQVPKQAG